MGFHCPACDFYLHTMCALLLPGKIRHKYDKHSLSLRYYPAENHSSEYFCEICEDELNPQKWFYHCSTCASSMHTVCAPLKLHCERSLLANSEPVFRFLNVKFGRTFEITDHPHPHPHPLTFEQGLSADGECDLQPHQKNKDDDEDKDDSVVEEPHVGKCKMCKEEIYSFHLCYYSCKDCDYSLHKFCAQLPLTQPNHPLHPDHNLTLSDGFQFHDPDFNFSYTFDSPVRRDICKIDRKRFYNYYCSICDFNMDIICATMSKQKMDHPSHPHLLQRYFRTMISVCNACGKEHSGTSTNVPHVVS
ncbi:uncharacterized protein LOC143560438 [Bidens hawaiensis]|uniref:uncharacterized protein LOC143560438 n=1 Tax=Bidens hawaiensis TaxID=980011 RepID=UPI00404A968D